MTGSLVAPGVPGALGDAFRGALLPLEASGDGVLALLALFGLGLLSIVDGFRKWKQMRLMQDTPTEKIRSAAAGRTELNGTCHPVEGAIDAPFTDDECLVAIYEIEEWDEGDDDSSGSWDTVESGTLTRPFELDDGTGTMRVEPEEDATYEICDRNETRIRVGRREREPDEVVSFLRSHTNEGVPASGTVSGTLFGEKRRYTQEIIPTGEDLYLLGGAQPRVGPDGPDRLVLGRDQGSDEFVVSTLEEEALVSSYRYRAPAQIVCGLALSAVMLFLVLS